MNLQQFTDRLLNGRKNRVQMLLEDCQHIEECDQGPNKGKPGPCPSGQKQSAGPDASASDTSIETKAGKLVGKAAQKVAKVASNVAADIVGFLGQGFATEDPELNFDKDFQRLGSEMGLSQTSMHVARGFLDGAGQISGFAQGTFTQPPWKQEDEWRAFMTIVSPATATAKGAWWAGKNAAKATRWLGGKLGGALNAAAGKLANSLRAAGARQQASAARRDRAGTLGLESLQEAEANAPAVDVEGAVREFLAVYQQIVSDPKMRERYAQLLADV